MGRIPIGVGQNGLPPPLWLFRLSVYRVIGTATAR